MISPRGREELGKGSQFLSRVLKANETSTSVQYRFFIVREGVQQRLSALNKGSRPGCKTGNRQLGLSLFV
jgi:hypothetical protein